MNPLARIRNQTIIAMALWVIVVGLSYYWNIHNERGQIVALAEVDAKTNLKRDLAFREWSTSHGGIYLRVDGKTRPSPFLADVPERDVPTPSGGMLTLQNPAATLRELKEKQIELYGEPARITGFKVLNPINAPDDWEKKALGIVDKTRQDYSEVVTINGKPYLRRMQPMFMEEGCLKCHAWTGIKVGGLRGATDIAIPLDVYQAVVQKTERTLAKTHGGILLVGLAVIGLVSRRSRLRAKEIIQYQENLEQLARHDSLTGLLNRRYFFDLAEQELARALRHDRPLSLLMIDIDLFKQVNDTYGHAVGDKTLQKLSQIFSEIVREIDIVCRMGGEEFAILLPETGKEEAIEVAERLRLSVEKTEIPMEHGLPLHFTISIGVASLKKQSDNIDTLLSRADNALYEAKRTGRNRVCT